MRKLILASVLLLASVSAHAGELRDWALASGDTPAATDAAQPLPPVAAPEEAEAAGLRAGAFRLPPSRTGEPRRRAYEAERYEAKRSEGQALWRR